MTFEFVAEKNPSERVRAALEALHPENPFCNQAYSRAIEDIGSEVFSLLLTHQGELADGCYGFVSRGKLSSRMEISSAPATGEPIFWNGVLDACKINGITNLEVLSFGSPSVLLPRLEGEQSRAPRVEYTIDLPGRDLLMTLSATHRQRVRKAEKTGVTIERNCGKDAVITHWALMEQSMSRRKERGEEVPESVQQQFHAALVERGAAELFQARLNGEAVSSGLTLKSARGAYYHSSGTTREGMQFGASHLLIHRISVFLQAEQFVSLNLGGADPESGLADFKKHFGARAVPLQAASFDTANLLQKGVMSILRQIRSAAR